MTIAKRLIISVVMLALLLTGGTVFAAPELFSATTSLLGALIPGSEITFTVEGTPNCVATLNLTLSVAGSSTPLTWSNRMQEEEPGLYVYRWTVWENMDVTLSSATVQLRDAGGQQSSPRDILGGAVAIGGEIRGRVTDALVGTPLAGVQVMAYSPSTKHFALATTNQHGDYTLPGLGTAKDYRLWTVNDLGYTEAKKEKLAVSNGGSTVGIDLALAGRSAVVGYIEDESGNPLRGVDVIATQQDGAAGVTASSDDQGRFTLVGLAPGSYDLRARSGSAMAAASVELPVGKIATASFRLAAPRPLPICQVVFPDLAPDLSNRVQVAYWPRQGGSFRLVPLAADGTATLYELMTGEDLVISLIGPEQPPVYYDLSPIDQGPYMLVGAVTPASSDLPADPVLTFVPPLVTRGGSALLSGRAAGMEWVDLWVDDQLEARLPVSAGRWQTNLSLDQGDHQLTVMAVGRAAPLAAERQVAVERTRPTVSHLKVNQQPYPSWYSSDGGGEIRALPKQPLTISLTTTQAGSSNWLVLGERQWIMGKLGEVVTGTIPADALVDGEHLLTWRWERQGLRGEVPLGMLVVHKPLVRTVVDALTGEPISGVSVILEQLTDSGWEIASTPHLTSDDRGRVSLWLADQANYRLRLTKPGYQSGIIPLGLVPITGDPVISLIPTRPSGPISISPRRDERGVDPSTAITVTFAKDLVPKSVSADTFYIQGVNAKVSYDPLTRKATLAPIGKLGANSYYLVHLSGRIRYADGTPLGRDLWWLISTAASNSEEERSSASKMAPVGQGATLTPRDSAAKAVIPAGSSPVQTLYRLTRPSTLPKALPNGWRAVAAPLSFTATHSPLDKPIFQLQQGADISIFYTEPPAEGQTVALWRYDPAASAWVEHPYVHDPYLRTVRFTTNRPGTYVFAKN